MNKGFNLRMTALDIAGMGFPSGSASQPLEDPLQVAVGVVLAAGRRGQLLDRMACVVVEGGAEAAVGPQLAEDQPAAMVPDVEVEPADN